LRRQYELLTMEEEESISQYFYKVINLTNQMTRNGENVTDVMKVEKVLRTLTPRFDHIVDALEESKDLDSMKIEELQASKSVSSDQALQAQHVKKGKFKKGKKPWIDYSNKEGEGSSKNQESNRKEDAKQDQKKKKDKKDIQCYNC